MALPSQNDNQVPVGQQTPNSTWGQYNNINFAIQQALLKMQTSTLVQIVSCTNEGELAPVGFVDVIPMVNQIDSNGNPTPHVTIYNIPYLRIQGGANGIIIDPEPGDIGICVFASRDISKIKATKAKGNPGSHRSYSFSDGMYMGGCINGTPNQYIQFTNGVEGGITIHTPHLLHEEADIVLVDADTSVHIQTPSYNINADTGTITTGGTTADWNDEGFSVSTKINAQNGFQVNGAAPEGDYLRGNGALYVSSPLEASDLVGSGGSSPIDTLLPSQTGHAGEFLFTNGATASWNSFSASGTVIGTANQIIVTPSGTSVILSTPQNINTTANVVFGTVTSGNIAGTAFGSNTGDQTITLTGAVTGSGTGTFTTTLATVNSNVGTFGDGTHVSQVTVNAKGLITAASSVLITGASPTGSAGGDLTGSYPNPTLATVNSNVGSFGNSTTVAVFTVNGKGLITAASSSAISFPVTSVFGLTGIVGNLTGDITSSGIATTLATVNSNTGAWGDATHVGSFTVNGKGLITAASSTAITFPVTSVFGLTGVIGNLTGDITSSGVATTLATVNSNTGTFGNSTNVAQLTVNAKGLITAVTNVAISSNNIVVAYIRDEQTSGTGGQTLTAATWNIVRFNTEIDPGNIVSISSNVFTLIAGSYVIEARCPCEVTNRSQARLYDVTNSSILVAGSNAYSDSALGGAATSTIYWPLTIASSTAFRIEQNAQTTGSAGFACSFGTEVYGQVLIMKIA